MRSKAGKKHPEKKPTREDLKSKPWETRGNVAGLRARTPSKRHLIDSEPALLVAELCERIARHCERNRFTNLKDCPEYRLLEELCYAVGFVAGDMAHMDDRTYRAWSGDDTRMAQADFPDIRRFMHTLWRSERNNVGDETGGGFVIEAARGGVLTAAAARIRQLVEGASQA